MKNSMLILLLTCYAVQAELWLFPVQTWGADHPREPWVCYSQSCPSNLIGDYPIKGEVDSTSPIGYSYRVTSDFDVTATAQRPGIKSPAYPNEWRPTGTTLEAWIKIDSSAKNRENPQDMTVLNSGIEVKLMISADGKSIIRQTSTDTDFSNTKPQIMGQADINNSLFDSQWHYLVSDLKFGLNTPTRKDTLVFYLDGAIVGQDTINPCQKDSFTLMRSSGIEIGFGYKKESGLLVKGEYLIGRISGYMVSMCSRPSSYYASYWNTWKTHINTATEAQKAPSMAYSLSIYPNPSTGPLTILPAFPEGQATLRVYDVSGRLVRMFGGLTDRRPLAWDSRGVAAGKYVLELSVKTSKITNLVTLR